MRNRCVQWHLGANYIYHRAESLPGKHPTDHYTLATCLCTQGITVSLTVFSYSPYLPLSTHWMQWDAWFIREGRLLARFCSPLPMFSSQTPTDAKRDVVVRHSHHKHTMEGSLYYICGYFLLCSMVAGNGQLCQDSVLIVPDKSRYGHPTSACQCCSCFHPFVVV